MKIVSAMKARKRLVAQLQRVRQDIIHANRVIVGNGRDVDIDEALVRESAVYEKLVELKTAQAVANGPIWGKLLRMGEIRERIGFLRSISTSAGRQPARRWASSDDASDVEWEVHLDKADVDGRISDLERELAGLQDEVDQFNASTEIEIDVPSELLF